MATRIQYYSKFDMEPLDGKDPKPVLDEVVRLLELQAIPYCLSGGCLLGLVREGDFIGNDTDIDIALVESGHFMLPSHFKLIRKAFDGSVVHQRAYIHEPTNIIVDIQHYRDTGDDSYYYVSELGSLIHPKEWLDEKSTIEYKGTTYYAPSDIDAFLTDWYGDWRTPNPNGKALWK